MTTAIEEFEAQGTLQPGEPGWWKVWGATAHDIRVGDIVICRWSSGPDDPGAIDTFEVTAVVFRNSGVKVESSTGTHFVGAMQRIVLVRRGTKNTLSPFCR